MQRVYKTPGGDYSPLYRDMAMQPHLLIGGATGTGKSTVINGIIHSLLYDSPARVKFILIDPKKVNLLKFARLPHVLTHATDRQAIYNALARAVEIMDNRFSEMSRAGIEDYNGAHVYVVIDELMDICTSYPKAAVNAIQYLAQVGRAARVHVIAASQHIPIIPRTIRCNFDARVGLHTEDKQDSRNIIGVTGCECLPKYGQGYYKVPCDLTLYKLPMIDKHELQRLINYWTGKAGRGKLRLFNRG